VIPLDVYHGSLRLRLKREGGAITIEYFATDGGWVMFRTAYLSTTDELEVGRMVAAPDGDGFEAVFSEFSVKSLGS
jgi:regulation of enolase protein 1 (concanavalin A-like superfamily)